jgi:L-histidine Nalpha-methyltransferase
LVCDLAKRSMNQVQHEYGSFLMDSHAVAVRSPKNALTDDYDFELDVIAGLGGGAKRLPSKYFYDADGSALFERITGVREYYVTRSEIGILNDKRLEIGSLFPSNCALIELGAGSSRKSRILLGATASIAAYVPLDISGDFLQNDVAKLRSDFPYLAVHPVVCDFTEEFDLPEAIASLPRVGFFPGSTVGNLEPREARRLLQYIGKALGNNAILVVGVDLVKDSRILTNAYDDAAGVTARFNLNLLKRINRELEGNFNLKAFQHRAFFNEVESRVEMHLVSMYPQEVCVGERIFRFRAGETIHTENSYKYTMESFQKLAGESGWSTLGSWTDNLFSVHAFANR